MQPRSSNSQQTSETDIIVMMMMMMLHIGNLELKVVKQYLAQGTTAMWQSLKVSPGILTPEPTIYSVSLILLFPELKKYFYVFVPFCMLFHFLGLPYLFFFLCTFPGVLGFTFLTFRIILCWYVYVHINISLYLSISQALESGISGFEFWLCHFLSMWPWEVT